MDDFAFNLFVVHAATDEAFVRGSLLPSLGLPSARVRLTSDLPIGEPMASAIAEAVDKSRLTVAVLTPGYLEERWTVFGDRLATHVGGKDARLVPLLLETCALPLHLDFLVALDFRDRERWESESARLRARLNQPPPPAASIGCPYPGLRSFEAADASHFHGRTGEIERVIGRLRSGEPRLLILGPSGSGKSSFVKAGILPRLGATASPERSLASSRSSVFAARVMQPGATPARSLAAALGEAESVVEAVHATLAAQGAGRLILVIDQLEELFTQCRDPAERQRFVSAFGELTSDARCSVVLTLRADFYGELMESELWAFLGDRTAQVHLAPLKGPRLAEAIEEPARAVGVYFEPSLRDRLLADAASEPGALPLLQVTLGELWDKRRRNYVCLEDYVAMGGDQKSGLALALEHRADAVLHQLARDEQVVAQRVFLRLVAFGEGRSPTRRQQAVSMLSAAADDPTKLERVLGKLTEGRLVTRDTKREGDALVDVVDLAHEALLTAWPTYSAWVETRRSDEQRRRTLEAKAAEWVERGRGEASLLDAVELAEAERWMVGDAARELRFGADFSQLVQASKRELHKQGSLKRRRQRVSAAAFAGFTVALAAFALSAYRSSQNATHLLGAAYEEEGRALLEGGRPTKALPYLVAARERSIDGAPLRALFARASSMVGMLAATLDHEGVVKSARFSPDSKRLLTASSDKTARVWDAKTGRPLTPPLEHQSDVVAASFSPDGTRVATASMDHTARLWDAATGKALTLPLEHPDNVHDIEFSPDGKRVVTACRDGTARIWESATGQPDLVLQHAASVDVASFSPDGERVVTASRDHTARVWDATTGRPVTPPLVHLDIVVTAVFSPDGKRVVTASWDRTARVWDANTGEPVTPPLKHESKVWSANFSPDGKRVVTASQDETARVWIVATGDPSVTLHHDGGVIDASFSPDGASVVTASWDHAARIWDAATGKPLTPLFEHLANLNGASFSPDGASVVTAGWDRTARVWNVRDAVQPMVRLGHEARVTAISFSPDGARVATASDDKTARVWDARDGTPRTAPLKHRGNVHSVSFSPDGKLVVTASDDRTARVWDAASGQPIGQPMKHGDTVWKASFSSDATRVVTASDDGTARVWDATTGLPVGPPLEHRDAVWDASFSPDGGRVVTASKDGTARVWDARSGRPLTPAMRHEGALWMASFSPDGRRVVTASEDGTARVWDAATGDARTKPLRHENKVRVAAFSPDGKRVVTASEDGTARIWDAETGEPLTERLYHRNYVNSAAFSPDGSCLVTGSGDGAASLWNAANGKLLVARSLPDGLLAVRFSPDGTHVALACADGTVRIWDLGGAPSTLEEWQDIGREGPYVLARGFLVDNPAMPRAGR